MGGLEKAAAGSVLVRILGKTYHGFMSFA